MDFPPLRTHKSPAGPIWVSAALSRAEMAYLRRRIVTFVCRDPHEGTVHALGSGFIVGAANQILVLTAAHLFVEWLDRIRPAAQHALRGLVSDADVLQEWRARFAAAQKEQIFQAVVNPSISVDPQQRRIAALSLFPIISRNDTAIVQLDMPAGVGPGDLGMIMIDSDPFPKDAVVFMAGIAGSERRVARTTEAAINGLEIRVHAGHIAEYSPRADGYLIPMYRANMPSLNGMSGGPALVVRRALRPGGIILAGQEVVPTAVGIVSRGQFGRLAAPVLLDHCEEGETWFSPITLVLGQRVSMPDGNLRLSELIERGVVADYASYRRGAWQRDV